MAPNTALVLTDPYNDFLHPSGKLYSLLAASIEHTNTVSHLQQLVAAAHKVKIPIYYGLHQQCRAGFLDGWKRPAVTQVSQLEHRAFEEGSWGVEIFEGCEPDVKAGDVVVSKHWNSSSFENTDLDYQLRQRDITHLVMAGLTANTCLEATARQAHERGYVITMISDATAGFTVEQKDAATDLIWPLFAEEVKTTKQWMDTLE